MTEKYPFPVPESLVQEQIDARLERGLRALAAQGMDTEQMRKLDFVRLRAAQRDSAIRRGEERSSSWTVLPRKRIFPSATRKWTMNCN